MAGPEEGIYASSASQLVSSTAQEVSSACFNYDNSIQNSELELAQSQIDDGSINLLNYSKGEDFMFPPTGFISSNVLTQSSEQEFALLELDNTTLKLFSPKSGHVSEEQSWNATNSNEIIQQDLPSELTDSGLDELSYRTKISLEACPLLPKSQDSLVGFPTPLARQPYDPEVSFNFEDSCPMSSEPAGGTSELCCLPDFDLFADQPIEDDVLPQECLEWAQLDQYDDDPYDSRRTGGCKILNSTPTLHAIKAISSAPNMKKLSSSSPVMVTPTSSSSSAVSTTGAQYALSIPNMPSNFNVDLSNKISTHTSRRCSTVAKNSVRVSMVPTNTKLTSPSTPYNSAPGLKSALSLPTVYNKNNNSKLHCTDTNKIFPSGQYLTGANCALPVSSVSATAQLASAPTSSIPTATARTCLPVSGLQHPISYPTPQTSPDRKFPSRSSMPFTKRTTIAAPNIYSKSAHVTMTAPAIHSVTQNSCPRPVNVTGTIGTAQNINPAFTKRNLRFNIPKNKYRLSRADIIQHEIATGAFHPPIPSNTLAPSSSAHQIPPDLRKTFDMLVDKFYDDEGFKKSTLAYITEMKEAGTKFTALGQQPQRVGKQYLSGEADVAGDLNPRNLTGMSLEDITAAFRELEKENFRTQKNKAYWLKCTKYYESVMPPPSRTYWSCNNVNGNQRCGRRNATWELIWTKRDKCYDCEHIPSCVGEEILPSPGIELNLTRKRQFSEDDIANKHSRCG